MLCDFVINNLCTQWALIRDRIYAKVLEIIPLLSILRSRENLRAGRCRNNRSQTVRVTTVNATPQAQSIQRGDSVNRFSGFHQPRITQSMYHDPICAAFWSEHWPFPKWDVTLEFWTQGINTIMSFFFLLLLVLRIIKEINQEKQTLLNIFIIFILVRNNGV